MTKKNVMHVERYVGVYGYIARVKKSERRKECTQEAGKECEKRKLQMFLKTREFFSLLLFNLAIGSGGDFRSS